MKVLLHNVQSLHIHFDDVACDYNVQAAEINIFVETRIRSSDCNTTYEMANFNLFRNDYNPNSNVRSSYGMAMYIKSNIDCATTPFRSNFNNIELTVCVLNDPVPNLHIVGIYRSKSKANQQNLIETINHLLDTVIPYADTPTVILDDFNVNLLEVSSEQKALTKCLLQQRRYKQLISQFATDYHTQIDHMHIYTNTPNQILFPSVLESYYSDHKPIFVCLA